MRSQQLGEDGPLRTSVFFRSADLYLSVLNALFSYNAINWCCAALRAIPNVAQTAKRARYGQIANSESQRFLKVTKYHNNSAKDSLEDISVAQRQL